MEQEEFRRVLKDKVISSVGLMGPMGPAGSIGPMGPVELMGAVHVVALTTSIQKG